MKPLLFFLIASIVSIHPLYAAAPLSLEEALATARENHPLLSEARAHLRGAEARTGQALASYYPQINFSADWNRGRTFIAAQEGIKTTETNSAALYLKQTLYDFGRTTGTVDAARANRDAIDHVLSATRQDIVLRVKIAFYLLLAAEKQVDAVSETVKARAETLRQAQEFFNHGIRAKVDVARAEANFYAAKTAQIRAENNREIARFELAGAMGMPSLGERTPVEPSSPSLLLPDRSRAHQDALHNRAELQQLAAQKSAASGTLKAARGSFLPFLSATANAGYADRDFPPVGAVWGVGLNLTMPLFSGFSSLERVSEVTATVNAIESRQANVRLQIGTEVEVAWLGANEATARMASTEKELAAAAENTSLAEGRYQEGVGSIIEVSDAQSQALESRTAHIQALYDFNTALARFDRAVGRSEK